jgi:hypothetical protein
MGPVCEIVTLCQVDRSNFETIVTAGCVRALRHFFRLAEKAGCILASNMAKPGTPNDTARISEEWIKLARVAMDEKGLESDAQLAAAAGVSGASITRLWRNQAAEKTIAKVARALGLEDPSHRLEDEEVDTEFADFGRRLRRLRPLQHAKVLRFIRTTVEQAEAKRDLFGDDPAP